MGIVEDPGRQADLPSFASSAPAEEMQKPELPWWLSGRGPACKAGDGGPIPGLGRSPEWQPAPVFLPGEPHRQRSLAGYGPRGRKSETRLSN